MKRGRNKLSIRDRTSVKAICRPTSTTLIFVHVSHRTEHKSCVWPNNFGVRTACALAFSQSDPHSLEDTSKCKLMFTVLLALCLIKQGQLKPFTHVPHTIFFVLEEFIGHCCVQIQTTTGSAFQTKRYERFKGHAIYGIVTVYRAVTV